MSHPLPGSIRQIGYVVHDLDVALKGWLDLGVGPWFVRSWPRGAKDSIRYAEPPAGATIVELMEFNEITKGLAKFVRDAADAWDGSSPIRPLN